MCINLLIHMFLGFFIESKLGSLRFMIFYLISGIGGTLFAATTSSYYAAGPEPAMFGLVAGLLGWFMFNWEAFDRNNEECTFGCKVCCFFLVLIIIGLMIYFMISMSEPYALYANMYDFAIPDTYGALGGFLYGLTSILWLQTPDANYSRDTC